MSGHVPLVIRLRVWWHRKTHKGHHSLLHRGTLVITCTGCEKRWGGSR